MKMTDFLNEFAESTESLLHEAERKIKNADKRLKLLEIKIQGIQQSMSNPVQVETSAPLQDLSTPPEVQQTLVDEPVNITEIKVEQEPPVERPNQLLVKDDPQFAKYFKMLKMGVVEQAVKIKMQSEGVDPAILDTPDAPTPNIQSKDEDNNSDSDDSVSSFSDSD